MTFVIYCFRTLYLVLCLNVLEYFDSQKPFHLNDIKIFLELIWTCVIGSFIIYNIYLDQFEVYSKIKSLYFSIIKTVKIIVLLKFYNTVFDFKDFKMWNMYIFCIIFKN